VGLEVIECHSDLWGGIEDKSQMTGIQKKARHVISLFLAYPSLIYRYLCLPPHDVVVVSYMGQFDVLLLWLFARLRRTPICWDVFIPLYEAVIIDRKIASPKSIIAFFLYIVEWLASRAANVIFLDTKAHAKYFEELYHLPPGSVGCVYLGAELDVFKAKKTINTSKKNFTVLFYGQFIPLHRIDTIVQAAKITEQSGNDIDWIIIGKGQEQPRIDALIEELGLKCIARIPWVPYERLIDHICEVDVCLGIFGDSGKALRVIPNKVFQILAAGKPLITGVTPAARELLEESPFVRLVPPGDPNALASIILAMREMLQNKADAPADSPKLPVVGFREVGNQFLELLELEDGEKTH